MRTMKRFLNQKMNRGILRFIFHFDIFRQKFLFFVRSRHKPKCRTLHFHMTLTIDYIVCIYKYIYNSKLMY